MKRTGFKRREGPTSERETKPRARPAPKPGKCKHCKQRLEIVGKVIHDDCIPAFAAKVKAKSAAAKVKAEKAQDRATRERLKGIPDLIQEADKVFADFIRLRDKIAGHACISSGRPLDWSGNQTDAGHYRSRGAASHLRYHEDNCHAQSKHDNRFLAGNAVDYRIGLIARIGLARVEALEADNKPHKWTKEELIGIRDKYRAMVNAMKKEQA